MRSALLQIVGGENNFAIPYAAYSQSDPEWFWPPPTGPAPNKRYWGLCWSNRSLVQWAIGNAKKILTAKPGTKFLQARQQPTTDEHSRSCWC